MVYKTKINNITNIVMNINDKIERIQTELPKNIISINRRFVLRNMIQVRET